MVIPIEAIPEEEWKRIDKGLPPLKKEKTIRLDPIPPKVDNQIKFEDVPIETLVRIQAVKKHVVRNDEGIIFIGYDAIIELKDGKTLAGYFFEGDMENLKRFPIIRENTDARLLNSIGY